MLQANYHQILLPYFSHHFQFPFPLLSQSIGTTPKQLTLFFTLSFHINLLFFKFTTRQTGFPEVRRAMVLAAVEDLSDEERCNDRCPPKPKEEHLRHRRFPRFKRKRVATYESTVDLTRLRHLISSKCGCGCKCFHPFHGSIQLFEEWAKLRRLMAKMTKLEKDQQVT